MKRKGNSGSFQKSNTRGRQFKNRDEYERQQVREALQRIIEREPNAADRARERRHSESEGKYEQYLVRQALRDAAHNSLASIRQMD